MKYSELYPSKWLSSDDLEDGDLTLTIADVEIQEFPPSKGKPTPEHKPVVHFREPNTKSLILNKTNFKTIAQVLKSEETDDWTGKKITLYATEVESFGEMTMAIRVRLRAPKSNGDAASTDTNSDDSGDATAFWTEAKTLGISRDEAKPFAAQAASGQITWAEAIKKLNDDSIPF